MDRVWESLGAESGICRRILTWLAILPHRLYCSRCNERLRQLEEAREFMKTGFFPSAPDFEERVMKLVREQSALGEVPEPLGEVPAISFRGWIITGCIVLLSLGSAFFGMDFTQVAANEGSSFLVSIGLTIGMVVTGYGALFIGTHLKELSIRFRLH
jgi:hypothetical protein